MGGLYAIKGLLRQYCMNNPIGYSFVGSLTRNYGTLFKGVSEWVFAVCFRFMRTI